jgi:hypothetical protein
MNTIGVLANWYQGVSSTSTDDSDSVSFKPLINQYHIGYLSMEHYRYTIDGSCLRESDKFSFSVPKVHLSAADENWRVSLSFDYDF